MRTISSRLSLQIVLTFFLLLNAGCGTIGILVDGNGGHPGPEPRPGHGPGPRTHPSYRALNIPPGHLPPPGQCRVWYPGKPPGHQPPPTSCESALTSAGMDSWVLYRDSDDAKTLEVKERKRNGPTVEIVISHYLID